jgi:hypothetical protein
MLGARLDKFYFFKAAEIMATVLWIRNRVFT